MAMLSRYVTKRSQEIRLSRSSGPDQHSTFVLVDEVAVEQPLDRGLGNPLRELEIVLRHGLLLGEPCLPQPPLESRLLAGSLFQAEEYSQDLQHRAPFAGCLIQH